MRARRIEDSRRLSRMRTIGTLVQAAVEQCEIEPLSEYHLANRSVSVLLVL